MICPNCGARDVVSTSIPDEKVYKAECLHCEFTWEQPVDHSGQAEKKAAGDEW